MRVISGLVRGRKLKDVKIDIRPTSDKIKESVFNIIQFDIEGRRVLDLYAGSGQLGIEALSRGADRAVFVDSNPKSAKLISENLKLCGFSELADIYTLNTLKYLEKSTKKDSFDIIFIDPPYDTKLLSETVSSIVGIDKLNSNGIIICESSIDIPVPTVEPPYFLFKEYKYGNTRILKYTRQ
jgi:16S rRNA (guanine(966)-N(2))-methyltransferase RsmD